MIECVPNFSEGRDGRLIAALQAAIVSVEGITLLDRTSDYDHHRSVITFAGAAPAVAESALRAAATALERIDLRSHRGIHPRLGALDVLPFVPLGGTSLAGCVRLAHQVGERIWNELGLPVYFYAAAALKPERRQLEEVRRGQFEGIGGEVLADASRRPDLGGPALHPTGGAVIVGARNFLVAFNINLDTTDVSVAKSIAKRIRASNGGLPGVKALGLPLASCGRVQVSMNLTEVELTPLALVYAEVERLSALEGVAIAESELIGLMPQQALAGTTAERLKLKNFSLSRIIENRLGGR